MYTAPAKLGLTAFFFSPDRRMLNFYAVSALIHMASWALKQGEIKQKKYLNDLLYGFK